MDVTVHHVVTSQYNHYHMVNETPVLLDRTRPNKLYKCVKTLVKFSECLLHSCDSKKKFVHKQKYLYIDHKILQTYYYDSPLWNPKTPLINWSKDRGPLEDFLWSLGLGHASCKIGRVSVNWNFSRRDILVNAQSD